MDAALLAARLTVPLPSLLEAARSTRELVVLGPDPGTVISTAALGRLAERTTAALTAFHAQQPLRAGMPREELRERVFAHAAAPAFERVLSDLDKAGRLRLLPDAVALARHQVTLSAGEEEAKQLLVDSAQSAALAGVELPALASASRQDPKLLERVSRVLVSERVLARVGDSLLVHREHLDRLKQAVRERWPSGLQARGRGLQGHDRAQPQVRDPAARVPRPRARHPKGRQRPLRALTSTPGPPRWITLMARRA